jgi:hypothetical protein
LETALNRTRHIGTTFVENAEFDEGCDKGCDKGLKLHAMAKVGYIDLQIRT